MIGQTLGPYRITTEVARGGQATLYKAVHTVLGRETALKVLHPHLITVADFLQKFEAESKILARLKHPNIVAVYDAGVDQGLYWIAMEWLDGQAVDDLIDQQGKLAVDLAVRIADQVAAALEYAHAQGLIHRDIKPGNMMLLPDGMVKVLDFGIAAIIAAGQKAVTRIGTVEYMSYEQFNGQADHRSDLYSLGASLYHMLTGQLPPPLATHPPTPPRQLNPAIPPGLEQLLYHLLAQQPEARPQTATAFRRELQAALTAPAIQTAPFIPCPHCGAANRLGARHCRACGKPLAPKVSVGMGPLRIMGMFMIAQEHNFKPEFSWSPDGTKLAFLSRLNEQSNTGANLYIQDSGTFQRGLDFVGLRQALAEGRRPKVRLGEDLTFLHPSAKNVEPATPPIWSPDRKMVAYVSMEDHKVWVTENGRTRQFTWGEDSDDYSPAWSPDGQVLLYCAKLRTTGKYEWRLLDPISRRICPLTSAETVYWSPNGSRLVSKLNKRASHGVGAVLVMEMYNRSGQLLETREVSGIRHHIGPISWLDEERVILICILTTTVQGYEQAFRMWVVDFASRDSHCIGGSGVFDFKVSPSRRWIATACWAVGEEAYLNLTPDSMVVTGTLSIHLISTNDYAISELQTTAQKHKEVLPFWFEQTKVLSLYGWSPDSAKVVDRTKVLSLYGWSPDSAKVVFGQDQEIWVVNVNDTGLQRLTEGYAPQWSPDGRHIAFLRSPQEKVYELWVIRVETA